MEYVNDAVAGMAKTWRNKDTTKTMTLEEIKYFGNLALQVPSKQSNKYFEVVAISNQDVITSLYEISAPPDSDGKSAKILKNSQIFGSMILVYVTCPLDLGYQQGPADTKISIPYLENAEDNDDEITCDTHQAIGISAGTVAYEANRQGFVTGFCRCYESQKALDIIHKHVGSESNISNNLDKHWPELILSIGYPKFTDRHKHQHLNSMYKEHKKTKRILHIVT
jgi:hypothetical protein